jgi:hypothetical protein
VGAIFSAFVQTDHGDHPASCTVGNGVSLPGVKWTLRGVNHPPPSTERVQLYTYSPSGSLKLVLVTKNPLLFDQLHQKRIRTLVSEEV